MTAPATPIVTPAERITLAKALWELLSVGIEIGTQDIQAQQQQPALIPVPVKY